MNYFERRKRRKEYDRLINLRYEKWLENAPEESFRERELREGFEVIQTTIENLIKSSTDETEISILQSIYSIDCKTEEDFNDKVYLFNDGDLRPLDEVTAVMNYRYSKKKFKLGDFNKERHRVNACAFFIPFTVSLILCFMLFYDGGLLFGLLLGLPISLTVSMICMLIGYKHNIERAKDYGFTQEHPIVQEEELKFKAGVASCVTAAVHIAHHTKKAVKEVADPDSWKEMK